MVSTIAPLVQEAASGRVAIQANVLFAGACIAGGAVVGAAAGAMGQLVIPAGAGQEPWHFLVPLAVVGALIDSGVFGWRAPELSGSVPREWWTALGPRIASVAYGWILGLGFTTFIPVAGYYVLLVAAALAGTRDGLILGAVYGLFRALAVPIASVVLTRVKAHGGALAIWSFQRRPLVRRASAVALLVVALMQSV